MKTTKAAVSNDQLVQDLPIGKLIVSPEETRKTIDQAALQELAKSIEEKGVIEALLVRPLLHEYEIVAGQRRWLASKLIGRVTVPCVVRQMSDDEARELRVISNLQREDLPPMEEAEAYGKLLERPGATIDTVAATLAKTPSYVGRRLQLLKAIEPVRSALKAGAIEVGHALELARLSERMQSELLSTLNIGGDSIGPNDVEDESGESGTCRFCGCTDDNGCPGGCSWANDEETICTNPNCIEQFREEIGEESTFCKTFVSVAELRGRIERQSLRVLTAAPFPLDGDLAPMPCTDCPKRSTNAVLLFDDCAQDTCTDRRCYDAKVGAWIQAELERAKAAKQKLLKLTTNWSSDKDRIQVSEHSYGGAKLVTAEHECQHEENGIWIDGENVGRRAIICRNDKCERHFGKRSSSSSSGRVQPTPKEKEDRRKLLDKVKATKAYRAALVAAIADASVDVKTLETLQIDVCCRLIEKTNSLYAAHLTKAIGWDEKLLSWNGRTQLRAKVTELSTARRFLVARLCEEAGELSVNEYNVNGRCEDLEKLARMVGVDSKKLKVSEAAPAKPEKPVPAKKAAKRKPVLSVAARKRIAEAQKRRWAANQKAAKKKAVRK